MGVKLKWASSLPRRVESPDLYTIIEPRKKEYITHTNRISQGDPFFLFSLKKRTEMDAIAHHPRDRG